MNAPSKRESLKIVAGLAMSPRARDVAGEALSLAREVGAELTFVHVVAEKSGGERESLEALLREAGMADPAAGLVVARGAAAEAIGREARRLKADMILAGAKDKESFLTDLIGSVARRLVRKAPCPVLLLTEPLATGHAFRRVVVCAKMDAESLRMIRFTLRLIRAAGGQFAHIVYETEYIERMMQRFESDRRGDPLLDSGQRTQAEQARLKALIEDCDFSGLTLETRVLEGADGLPTVEYAREVGADLLVFPAPTRSLTLWDRFTQHPTEVVMQQLPCAVLFYRERAAGKA